MYTEIGVFDAKSRLSELLQKVKHGKRFTITLRGRPIADLIPSEETFSHDSHVAIEALRNISKVKGVSTKTLNEWIREGRE